jgi:hypothetical protein
MSKIEFNEINEETGLGECPIGITPFGMYYFTPSDPVQFSRIGNRQIDKDSGDYLLNPTLRAIKNGSTTITKMILAIKTIKGSSTALPNFGNNTMNDNLIDNTLQTRVNNHIRTACKQMTDAGEIRIVEVIVKPYTGGPSISVDVKFLDLRSRIQGPQTLQLRLS